MLPNAALFSLIWSGRGGRRGRENVKTCCFRTLTHLAMPKQRGGSSASTTSNATDTKQISSDDLGQVIFLTWKMLTLWLKNVLWGKEVGVDVFPLPSIRRLVQPGILLLWVSLYLWVMGGPWEPRSQSAPASQVEGGKQKCHVFNMDDGAYAASEPNYYGFSLTHEYRETHCN